MKKILITGGHVTPALAMLPELKKIYDIHFVIRKNTYEGDTGDSFEYKTIKDSGLPYTTLTTGRLQRHLSIYTLRSILKIPYGFMQSFTILKKYKPDLVLSFGGYIALPICIAAYLLKIPIVTHEQSIKGGLANKIIARVAQKICVTFEESIPFFPGKKVVVTGNPIRPELFSQNKQPSFLSRALEKNKNLPILYITGGSGGSHTINSAIFSLLDKLLEKYIVVHQVGDITLFNDYEKAKQFQNSRYVYEKHMSVEDLSWLYKHIVLLIGRSGANTVYEILTFHLPSLLIPLNSEQADNAALVEKSGLGKIISEEDVSLEHIEDMIMQGKSAKKSELVIPDAHKKILAVLESVQI